MLPTLALMLISLAAYSRYSRANLLDVMNQDYIRTARAKGVNERTVVMRHAFRNALIPLTTIVAFDVGGLIGGAIITETIFGWKGMGVLFNNALKAGRRQPGHGVLPRHRRRRDHLQHPGGPGILRPRPQNPGDSMSIPPPPPGSRTPDIHLSPGTNEPNLGDQGAPISFDVVEELAARTDGNIEASENAIELKEVEGLSQGKIVRRRFFRHRGAMISLFILIFIILLAFTSEGFTLWGFRIQGWWMWDYTTPVAHRERRPADLGAAVQLRHPPVRAGRPGP